MKFDYDMKDAISSAILLLFLNVPEIIRLVIKIKWTRNSNTSKVKDFRCTVC